MGKAMRAGMQGEKTKRRLSIGHGTEGRLSACKLATR